MSAFTESSALPATVTAALNVTAADGARSELICVQSESPRRVVYWLPAMGVPAKHYLPLAEALAENGIGMALHEWRGVGSSDRRAGRGSDWGYRHLLEADLAAGMRSAKARWPQAVFWIGGHSLGGQLACLYASLHPQEVAGIALVASGSPYWRKFSWAVPIWAAYALAAPLSTLLGYLPGRRIGFGGNEAPGVIADWSRSGRTGRYAARGMAEDFERRLAALQLPVLALRMRDDWLGPAPSLAWLLGKMPQARICEGIVTPDQLAGQPADHFSWMKVPGGVAAQVTAWMAAMGGPT